MPIMNSHCIPQQFCNAVDDLNIASVNKKCNKQVQSSVIVAVRIRPFTTKEKTDDHVHNAVAVNEKTVSVTADSGFHYNFTFDHCLWSFDTEHPLYCSQAQVYQLAAFPLLQHAFEGYNACLFAYGQTGSGKSYTIMGNENNEGIIPRFCQQLFDRVKKISDHNVTCLVEVSYFEIYNEKIYDLLVASEEDCKKRTLRVREHPIKGPYVEDLSVYVVSCYADLKGWLELGNKQRATASTAMNDHSSRSHSIFTITLTQVKVEKVKGEEHEHNTTSHINIVDLAGSERVSTAQTSGERLKEGASINRSLLTLGKVIAQLTDQSLLGDTPKKSSFISYRESVLTWLLKESLGGNSHTVMITTISPSNLSIEETLSCLRYASQARRIINRARINEDPKARLINELWAEIEKLRNKNQQVFPQNCEVYQKEILYLKMQLKNHKSELDRSKRSWQERLELAELKMKEQKEFYEKQGIALQMKEVTPYLINLHKDPQLSETLIYILQPGEKTVGNLYSSADIKLHGNLISKRHCSFWNKEGTVTVLPLDGAPVYVNGCLIYKTTTLFQGDRVVLGGEHFFRFHNPFEAKQSQSAMGFDIAYQEVVQQQETKMKEELSESREKTCKEIREHLEDYCQEMEPDFSFKKQSFENEDQINAGHSPVESSLRRSSLNDELIPWQPNLIEWITETFPDVFSNTEHAKTEVKNVPSISEKEGSLYELSLMLKEANHLMKKFNLKLVVSHCHILTDNGLEQAIRIQKNDAGIVTYWSLSDFSKRLERLRELNEANSEDDLFDITDVWDKESNTSSHFHPSSHLAKKFQILGEGHMSKLLNTTVFSSSSSCSLLSSSTLFSFHQSSGAHSTTSWNLEGLSIASVCCSIMADQVAEISDWAGNRLSVVDPAVNICCKLLMCIAPVKDNLGSSTGNVMKSSVTLLGFFLQLHAAVLHLISQWSYQMEHFYCNEMARNGKKEKMIINTKMTVLRVAKSLSFVFQGVEKCVESLVNHYSEVVKTSLLNLLTLIGRMSIDLQYRINWKSLEKQYDVASYLMDGVEKQVSEILKTSVEISRGYNLHINTLIDDSFFGPLWNSKNILHCAKDVMDCLIEWFDKCHMWQESWNGELDAPNDKYKLCFSISESVLPTVGLLSNLFSGVETLSKGSEDSFEIFQLLKVLKKIESNLFLVALSPSSEFAMTGRLEYSRKNAFVAIAKLEDALRGFSNASLTEDGFRTHIAQRTRSSQWNKLGRTLFPDLSTISEFSCSSIHSEGLQCNDNSSVRSVVNGYSDTIDL